MDKPQFSQFIYESFEILPEHDMLVFHYKYDDKRSYSSRFQIDLSPLREGKVSEELFSQAVFHLGLAELPSYYKMYCPEKVVIRAGYLSEAQCAIWKELYQKGLGEFFFENQIDFRNLLNIHVEASPSTYEPMPLSIDNGRDLVMIGGGKDSAVTGEIYRQSEKAFTWLHMITHINRTTLLHQVIEEMRVASGNTDQVRVDRYLDPQMTGAKDSYNGHIPFSLLVSYVGLVTSILQGYKYVVASNEKSANIGSVQYLGIDVNHQYSKSYECEKTVREYMHNYITPDVTYMSFLRPLYELQIAKLFSKMPQYHNKFVSCNRGKQNNPWCCECPKCAFVFAMMHAYTSSEEVTKIFGKNLYEDASLTDLFLELLGKKEIKPFDCVGVPQEVTLAMYYASQQYETLPIVLEQVKAHISLDEQKRSELQEMIENQFDKHHGLSAQHEEMLKQALSL